MASAALPMTPVAASPSSLRSGLEILTPSTFFGRLYFFAVGSRWHFADAPQQCVLYKPRPNFAVPAFRPVGRDGAFGPIVRCKRLESLSLLPMDAAIVLLLAAAAVLLAACGAPKDPESTTERVRASHVLRIGVTENPPWIEFHGADVSGRDAGLVQAFARTLGATVQWDRGSESTLLNRLKERKLDVAAGGFTSDTPWTDQLGTSQTYAGEHLIFSAPGENRLLLELDRFIVARKGPR
jgi:polar amino acid transport system substrate-binding protein